MKNDDWSLILEEDAAISPQINASIVYDLVFQSFNEIKSRNSHLRHPLKNGFAYLGMCRGNCKVNCIVAVVLSM